MSGRHAFFYLRSRMPDGILSRPLWVHKDHCHVQKKVGQPQVQNTSQNIRPASPPITSTFPPPQNPKSNIPPPHLTLYLKAQTLPPPQSPLTPILPLSSFMYIPIFHSPRSYIPYHLSVIHIFYSTEENHQIDRRDIYKNDKFLYILR